MQLDGEAVLLHLVTHKYFGLNATGTEVWELVRTNPGISAQDIAGAMGHRYARDPGEIVGDVTATLEELLHQHLVTSCAPSPAPSIPVERCQQHYLVPRLETYGGLDALILSGE